MISLFISLFLISLGNAAVPLAEGEEIQITADETDQRDSATYGDMIVWVDSRDGNTSENTEIYAYNLSSGEEIKITNNASLKYSPVIYGDLIAWEDFRNGNWDIYVYNLTSSRETQITLNTSDQYAPALYEDRLIWLDGRNGGGSLDVDLWPEGNWDIYMYNLSTSRGTRLTTVESWKTFPAIYNEKVLWIDGRNGETLASHQLVEGDIYMYDLSTSEETQLVTNVSADSRPDIFGERLVWEDRRNENSDVYMYDFMNSTEVQITDNESEQWLPSIYEDRIIWTDYRNGEDLLNPDVYMYNISTSEEMQVTDEEFGQWADDIYGNNIVFTDSRNGNYDIYMFTLSATEEVPEKEPVKEDYEEEQPQKEETNDEKPSEPQPDDSSVEMDATEELKILKAHVNSLEIEPAAKDLLNAKMRYVIQYLDSGDTYLAMEKLDAYIECVSIMKEKGRLEGIEADYIISEAKRTAASVENS